MVLVSMQGSRYITACHLTKSNQLFCLISDLKNKIFALFLSRALQLRRHCFGQVDDDIPYKDPRHLQSAQLQPWVPGPLGSRPAREHRGDRGQLQTVPRPPSNTWSHSPYKF